MNKRELKTKMLDILNDTVAFYSENTSRRATSNGDCMYYDKDHDTKCAIGRLLNTRDIKFLIKEDMLEGFNARDIEGCITSKKVKELPMSFLMDLQGLHDEDDYWSDTITKQGKRAAKEIKMNILNNIYI